MSHILSVHSEHGLSQQGPEGLMNIWQGIIRWSSDIADRWHCVKSVKRLFYNDPVSNIPKPDRLHPSLLYLILKTVVAARSVV